MKKNGGTSDLHMGDIRGGVMSRYEPDTAHSDRRRLIRVHIGTSASTFVINISEISRTEMSGTILHTYTDSAYRFSTLFEAVNLIQMITDALNFPERGYRLRRWGEDVGGAMAGPTDGIPSGGGISAGMGGQGAARGADEIHEILGALKTGSATDPGKPKLSFLVRIQYKQNASWQGEVQWVNGGHRTLQFRSVLEFSSLLFEACTAVRAAETSENAENAEAVTGAEAAKNAKAATDMHDVRDESKDGPPAPN
ncbi:MAG: hypothetical protein LBU58_11850 [Clostridiales bacterium]|jgi:hypothetical protein|nr:hypothetical protein [Clostridiales bacterium]